MLSAQEFAEKHRIDNRHFIFCLSNVLMALGGTTGFGSFVTAVSQRDWLKAWQYADDTNKQYCPYYAEFMHAYDAELAQANEFQQTLDLVIGILDTQKHWHYKVEEETKVTLVVKIGEDNAFSVAEVAIITLLNGLGIEYAIHRKAGDTDAEIVLCLK
jgi:hypothetical protein